MHYLQQILFVITLGVAVYLIRKRVLRIKANINLGKENEIRDRSFRTINEHVSGGIWSKEDV